MSIEYENPWFRVIKSGVMHFVEESGASNGAVALVEVAGHFHMVEVFRAAQQSLCLEAPRGYGDVGESSLDCALREVLEETGLRFDANEAQFLGRLMPNSALLASQVDVYHLRADARLAEREPDKEVRRSVSIACQDMPACLAEGKITDGFTLSALALLWARDRA